MFVSAGSIVVNPLLLSHLIFFFRNKSKSSKKVSSLEEEVQEVETRIAELQDTLEQLEQEAKEVHVSQEKLRVSELVGVELVKLGD